MESSSQYFKRRCFPTRINKDKPQKMNKINYQQRQYKKFIPEKTWLLALAVVGLIGGVILIFFHLGNSSSSLLSCGRVGGGARGENNFGNATLLQMEAIRHYATTRVVPMLSFSEITLSFDVLSKTAPCNFLVFGLGYDSLMWASLNPRGTTLFLEEDPKWVQTVLKDAPSLRAEIVKYRTQVSEADELLLHYQQEPDCSPKKSFLRGNERCRLALNMLSDKVYDTEWDLIMVDAPRGYFAEAPGRMAAIYSAAVMARNRKRPGVTHVFLHNVDRKVEKQYSEKFLCKKNLVNAAGRLWHFEIPPAARATGGDFC